MKKPREPKLVIIKREVLEVAFIGEKAYHLAQTFNEFFIHDHRGCNKAMMYAGLASADENKLVKSWRDSVTIEEMIIFHFRGYPEKIAERLNRVRSIDA